MVGQIDSPFSCSEIYFCSIFVTEGEIERVSERGRERERERESERERGRDVDRPLCI